MRLQFVIMRNNKTSRGHYHGAICCGVIMMPESGIVAGSSFRSCRSMMTVIGMIGPLTC